MAVDNELVVRKAYQIAEDKDLEGWVAAFTADDKIKRFDCYPEGSVILTQLGVIDNLGSALE
jgi:hypothetical protein